MSHIPPQRIGVDMKGVKGLTVVGLLALGLLVGCSSGEPMTLPTRTPMAPISAKPKPTPQVTVTVTATATETATKTAYAPSPEPSDGVQPVDDPRASSDPTSQPTSTPTSKSSAGKLSEVPISCSATIVAVKWKNKQPVGYMAEFRFAGVVPKSYSIQFAQQPRTNTTYEGWPSKTYKPFTSTEQIFRFTAPAAGLQLSARINVEVGATVATAECMTLVG